MKLIEKLTTEQEQQLLQYKEIYFNIGINTDPANRKITEKSISKLYSKINNPTPQFIWCDSPETCILMINSLKCNKLNNSLYNSLSNSLFNSLSNSLRNSLNNSLNNSLRNSLRNYLNNSLYDSLNNSLNNSLYNSLNNSLWNEIFYGQQEAYWISFYKFCQDILNVKYHKEKSEELELWNNITKNCCWWFPYDNICVCSEKPIKVNFNEEKTVLHCEDGPSVEFKDGFKIWNINGILVDEQLVMSPETQTLKQIEEEKNAEIQRIRIERYGWARYIEGTNSKIIHHCRNDIDNQYEILVEVNTVNGKRRKLTVTDPSTSRKYVLGVPRKTKTTEEAQLFLSHGLSKFCIHRS